MKLGMFISYNCLWGGEGINFWIRSMWQSCCRNLSPKWCRGPPVVPADLLLLVLGCPCFSKTTLLHLSFLGYFTHSSTISHRSPARWTRLPSSARTTLCPACMLSSASRSLMICYACSRSPPESASGWARRSLCPLISLLLPSWRVPPQRGSQVCGLMRVRLPCLRDTELTLSLLRWRRSRSWVWWVAHWLCSLLPLLYTPEARCYWFRLSFWFYWVPSVLRVTPVSHLLVWRFSRVLPYIVYRDSIC